MTTSDPERAVIEAAKALLMRLKENDEWYDNDYGQPTCIVCGYHENHVHDADCELATLMNAVDDMNNNPSFYTVPTVPDKKPSTSFKSDIR